jgi:glycosyltransferase involved in cell wall biosynthesis
MTNQHGTTNQGQPESTTKNKLKVSVVVPARNEERSIGRILDGCRPYADELMVVDGHSTDRTVEDAEAHGAKVIMDNGRGKGAAIRKAIETVTGDVVVFLDADGSHDPNDIPKLVAPILAGEADHVSGSRMLGGSSELHGGFDECFRLMGSSFIMACINWRFGVRLSESQNGFRAIKVDVARALGLCENITTIEQEMIMKTLRKGYRMAEVPTHEHSRWYGKSNINIRRVWARYVYTLIRYLLC